MHITFILNRPLKKIYWLNKKTDSEFHLPTICILLERKLKDNNLCHTYIYMYSKYIFIWNVKRMKWVQLSSTLKVEIDWWVFSFHIKCTTFLDIVIGLSYSGCNVGHLYLTFVKIFNFQNSKHCKIYGLIKTLIKPDEVVKIGGFSIDVSSYYAIVLTHILLKVLKTLINNRIMKHLDNKILTQIR